MNQIKKLSLFAALFLFLCGSSSNMLTAAQTGLKGKPLLGFFFWGMHKDTSRAFDFDFANYKIPGTNQTLLSKIAPIAQNNNIFIRIYIQKGSNTITVDAGHLNNPKTNDILNNIVIPVAPAVPLNDDLDMGYIAAYIGSTTGTYNPDTNTPGKFTSKDISFKNISNSDTMIIETQIFGGQINLLEEMKVVSRYITEEADTLKYEFNQILKKDDLLALKAFIQKNPNFDWTSSRPFIYEPWGKESVTPLIAATLYGAINCLTYLIKNNIKGINNSINTKSSRGYTALDYAKKPGKNNTKLKNNASSIINILQNKIKELETPTPE